MTLGRLTAQAGLSSCQITCDGEKLGEKAAAATVCNDFACNAVNHVRYRYDMIIESKQLHCVWHCCCDSAVTGSWRCPPIGIMMIPESCCD